MAQASWLAIGQFGFVALSYGLLTYAHVVDDFSVTNVFENSHSLKPLGYKISGVWGNHEGSMLLWVLILALFGALLAGFSRQMPEILKSNVLGVQALISASFLAFILFTSNPFARMFPAAAEGRDLNPILQDPGLAIHPPLLYLGYVGFSLVFSFAAAALIEGRIDSAWAKWVRPWILLAWIFLTLGIAMGSYWAYYTLGWGGFWFWDPVENASFMPWLVGTALIHSLAVTEKRGIFKSWTVLLAIIAFSLSLLGTFLVRSGVLTSVHAFATDPKRGVFILGFLVIVIGSSLALYAWRAPKLGLARVPGAFSPTSRESFLLANNILMVVAMLVVALGTLYPLFMDALGYGKISVGPPYFDLIFGIVMLPALFLMAIGPVSRWRNATLPELALRLKWAAAIALVAGIGIPLMLGKLTFWIALGLTLAVWIIAATLSAVVHRFRIAPQLGFAAKITANSPSFYGMHIAHIGIAVFVIGVTMVKGYEVERDIRMVPGAIAQEGGYEFKFISLGEKAGPNYQAVTGRFEVSRNGKLVEIMTPEKRTYFASGQTMTEAAIDPGVTRDLYVSLGEPVEGATDGAWGVRIYVKPFIDWIWFGCLFMALGGLLAILDKRYRLKVKQPAAIQPVVTPAPGSTISTQPIAGD